MTEIQRLPDFNEPLNLIVKQRAETGNAQLVLIAAMVRAGGSQHRAFQVTRIQVDCCWDERFINALSE